MDVFRPKNGVPAYLEVVDIAGLVRGAADGEGLGNAFLSHISAVDGIFHVCRGFEDVDVIHVEVRACGHPGVEVGSTWHRDDSDFSSNVGTGLNVGTVFMRAAIQIDRLMRWIARSCGLNAGVSQ